jgi:ribosomal-protein-serine acetyltransferase
MECGAESDVLIRPYTPADVPLLVDAAVESINEVFPWLPWCHPGYMASEAETWIEHCAAARGTGTEYNFVVTNGASRFLGGCGLNQLRPDHRIANLGYWIRTSASGHGVATAAVRRLTDFAFGETDLLRLEIVAAADNVASQRVAEKAGALREAVLRDRLLLHGKSHDAVLYSLVRSLRAHRQE